MGRGRGAGARLLHKDIFKYPHIIIYAIINFYIISVVTDKKKYILIYDTHM